MARKPKFYVVWRGRNTGIFMSWAETEAQVSGYPGARHKSYRSRVDAEQALANGPPEAVRHSDNPTAPHFANGREEIARRDAKISRSDELPF